jgi:hypothetical protein
MEGLPIPEHPDPPQDSEDETSEDENEPKQEGTKDGKDRASTPPLQPFQLDPAIGVGQKRCEFDL